jgi:hypothetical protein
MHLSDRAIVRVLELTAIIAAVQPDQALSWLRWRIVLK